MIECCLLAVPMQRPSLDMTFLLQHLDREFMKEKVLEEESMSIISQHPLQLAVASLSCITFLTAGPIFED